MQYSHLQEEFQNFNTAPSQYSSDLFDSQNNSLEPIKEDNGNGEVSITNSVDIPPSITEYISKLRSVTSHQEIQVFV